MSAKHPRGLAKARRQAAATGGEVFVRLDGSVDVLPGAPSVDVAATWDDEHGVWCELGKTSPDEVARFDRMMGALDLDLDERELLEDFVNRRLAGREALPRDEVLALAIQVAGMAGAKQRFAAREGAAAGVRGGRPRKSGTGAAATARRVLDEHPELRGRAWVDVEAMRVDGRRIRDITSRVAWNRAIKTPGL